MNWTTTSIIAAFKRRAVIPDSQTYVDDQEVLDFMNDVLRMEMVPLIMRSKEEFFVESETFTSLSEIPIPDRAIGMRIRKLEYFREGRTYELDRINPGLSNEYENVNSYAVGYEFFDNMLRIIPKSTPISGRLTYFRRPNQLALEEVCAPILTKVSNDVTVADASIFAIGQIVDVIKPNVYHKSATDGLEITNIVGNTISFADASAIAVGQYLSPEGLTCLPQIPEDLIEIWIQLGIVAFAEASGYNDIVAIAKARANDMMIHMFQMISDRDDNSPKKTVSRRNIWNFGSRRGF